MPVPTTATVSVEVDAPAEVVYDLLADVTRMGEWSPECRRCEWLDEPGQVGSRFQGHNRSGPARWKTTAKVLVSDRPREFTFATMTGDKESTRWSYRLQGDGAGRTLLSESFEAISAPWFVTFAERYLIRNRQQQLEEGMTKTLAAIKAAAEASAAA